MKKLLPYFVISSFFVGNALFQELNAEGKFPWEEELPAPEITIENPSSEQELPGVEEDVTAPKILPKNIFSGEKKEKRITASQATKKIEPKTEEQIEKQSQQTGESGQKMPTDKFQLTMGDEYLGKKRYSVEFSFQKNSPEEINLERIIEIDEDGERGVEVGRATKKKLEFSCSFINYARKYNYQGRRLSEIIDLKSREYNNQATSLLSQANLGDSLEGLGEMAGYNFATGQPIDSSLLNDAAKEYAVRTVEDIITIYSLGAGSSSDRVMSEIMKTLVNSWLSNKSDSGSPDGEFIRDLRASFLVQAISGKKYLQEVKSILENRSYLNETMDYKEIEYLYSKFKDGWTKGGVLKGWEKLENENFDRRIGKGIGKALAGKYIPKEIKRGIGVLNFIDNMSKIVESDEEKIRRRSEQLKSFLEDENIKDIFNTIKIETNESESFFDNFEKYR